MTDTASPRRERPRRARAALRVAVALIAAVTVMVVGLAGQFASPASAQLLTGHETRVAAFTAATGQVVGAHEPVLAGQRRARAPDYDRTAVGSCVAAEAEPVVANLGGEGEVAGAINQQPPNALSDAWGASRTEVAGKSLAELQAMGDPYVVAENTSLPFPNASVDQVITNSVPIDVNTPMGPGVQSSEIWRILKPGGEWLHNGAQVPWP